MIPILYGSVRSIIVSRNNKAYTNDTGEVYTVLKDYLNTDTLGIGALVDVIDGVVIEERNNQYELEFVYPISGRHYSDIAISCYVKVDPFVGGTPQLFEIYRITKPINGRVTIYARHVGYRLSYNTVMPFKLTDCTAKQAMDQLAANAIEECPFHFWSDFTGTAREFKIGSPSTFRTCLGGMDGSVLDHWSGEYEWDNFTVKLHKQRGSDNGVSLIYGKNITDLKQDENIENTVTGLVPFWKGYNENNEEVLVCADPVYSDNADKFPFKRTVPHDFSSDFSEPPTEELLTETTRNYIVNNKVGEPDIDLTVSFITLSDTIEYEHLGLLERVNLCDTVHVEFNDLGVSATAKVTRTEYDFLKERYRSVTLGSSKTNNISNTIQSLAIAPAVEQVSKSQSLLEQAIARSTNAIRGNNGGFVKILDANNDGINDEIVFLDQASGGDLTRARNVWRWNMGGLGFSSNGYGGPYSTAITSDGEIVATLITSGYLSSDVIQAGSLAIGKLDQSTQNTITTAASTASSAQSTANGSLKTTVTLYYRSTSSSVPAAPTAKVTRATDVSNNWTLLMPTPLRDATFYTCDQYTSSGGTTSWSTVRALATSTYESKWVSSNDATFIDGGAIYANSVTADRLAAKTLSISNFNDTDATKINDAATNASTALTNASTALTNAATAQSTANTSVKEAHVIYRTAANGTTTMAAPTAWIAADGNSQNTWLVRRPPYSASYPVCFTATQWKLQNGSVGCTTPKIDDTTTIIDGGRIITNSVTADAINVADLSAFEATIGAFNIDTNSLYSGTKDSGTANGDITLRGTGVFSRNINNTARSNLKFAIGSKFGVAQDGTVYMSGANVSGAITATSLNVTNATITGKISGSAIDGAVAQATVSGSCTGNAATATRADRSSSLSSTATLTRDNVNSATGAAKSSGTSVALGDATVYTTTRSGIPVLIFTIGDYTLNFFPRGITDSNNLRFYLTVTTPYGEFGICSNQAGTSAYIEKAVWS